MEPSAILNCKIEIDFDVIGRCITSGIPKHCDVIRKIFVTSGRLGLVVDGILE
jgi:hypothetical protein